MRPASTTVRVAEHWLASRRGRTFLLHRPAEDTWLEADGADEAVVRELVGRLRRGVDEGELPARVRRAFGRKTAGVLRALAEHEVLRPVSPPSKPRILGRGELAPSARWLAARGGWSLPEVLCPRRLRPEAGADRRPTLIAVGRIVLLAGPGACPGCALLRVLGRVGLGSTRGDAWSLPLELGVRKARALVAEAGRAASERPLGLGDALAVVEGEGVVRGRVITHGDCRVCRGARPRVDEVVRQTRRALSSSRAPAPRLEVADDPLSPMEIQVVEGPEGRYPLDVPFVWGGVGMVRDDGERIVDRSTNGGIYANAPRRAQCRLLAVSEGVERHELRAVRPDAWRGASTRRRSSSIAPIPDEALWSQPRSGEPRPYCAGLELTSGAGRLVPLEAVAVDPPAGLTAGGDHLDPFYTGGASHRTLREAVVHATVEVLERDAFVISWYRRRALTRLTRPRRPSAEIRRRLEYLDAHGIDVELFDLTLELPLPMVLMRLTARRRAGNWPKGGALLIPSGGFTPQEALRHALKLGCAQCVSLVAHAHPSKDPLDPAAVRRLARTVKFWPLMTRYLDPARAGEHAFIVGREAAHLEDLRTHAAQTAMDRFGLLRRWLKQRGYPWLVVRVTGPLARAAGFEVCRVVLPGFVALAPSRKATDFGLPRMHADWPGARPGLHRSPHPIY